MKDRRRQEWTPVEIASYALGCTSLSQLTLPEVKKLAACLLKDRDDVLEADRTDPKHVIGVDESLAKARGKHEADE